MMPVGPLLPLIALITPLLLGAAAALPPLRARALRLLPLAPVPALGLAIFGERGEVTLAPDLLLGATLGLDASGAVLLGVTAGLWLFAGIFAAAAMRDTARRAVFAGFWCLTLAGNLGVFLARDAVTFYVAFAVVSLPAYVLVVHDGTDRALRAGRVYIILAVVGETSLLAGVLIACAATDTVLIAGIRDGLLSAPGRDWVIALFVIGFGIKAGLVPLHVWLPLAHPAAPTAASAVLSGAIVTAGVFGLIAFLPVGPAMGGWSLALVLAGLAGAYYAVLVGLTQANPKTVLAYSTVSQMGLVIAAIGATLTAADPTHGSAVMAFYAAHHGLAKGALFLSVGIVAVTGRRRLPLALAVAGLASLSIAGLPLTGGGLAKTALKGLFDGTAEVAVTASAIGTSVLLVHFLALIARRPADDPAARPEPALAAPWLATTVAALLLPWLLLPFVRLEPAYALAPANLWAAVWPLAVAAALALLAWRMRPNPPAVPEGDLIGPLTRATPALTGVRMPQIAEWPTLGAGVVHVLARVPVDRIERTLASWSVPGLLLISFALTLAIWP